MAWQDDIISHTQQQGQTGTRQLRPEQSLQLLVPYMRACADNKTKNRCGEAGATRQAVAYYGILWAYCTLMCVRIQVCKY